MKHFCILILFFSRLVFLPTISVSMWVCTHGYISVYGLKDVVKDILLYLCILHCIVFHLIFMFQALMVWLWGINLWVFAQGGVNYAKIFDLDQNHLTHGEIWKVSTHHFNSCHILRMKSISLGPLGKLKREWHRLEI
jgi:hypothetical protein